MTAANDPVLFDAEVLELLALKYTAGLSTAAAGEALGRPAGWDSSTFSRRARTLENLRDDFRSAVLTPEELSRKPSDLSLAMVLGAFSRAETKRQVQLESALDPRTLVIGGYRAHWERFLGSLVENLHRDFPWIPVKTQLFTSRKRDENGSEGELSKAFKNGKVDYMLTACGYPPCGREQHAPFTMTGNDRAGVHDGLRCYEYRFVVVGSYEQLPDNGSPTVSEGFLAGKSVIAAERGYSSREKIAAILDKNKVEVGAWLDHESDPLMMRISALAGAGVTVQSDEYTMVHHGRVLQVPLSMRKKKVSGAPTAGAGSRLRREDDRKLDEMVDMVVAMSITRRPEIALTGVHKACAYVVEQMTVEEERDPRSHPSAMR